MESKTKIFPASSVAPAGSHLPEPGGAGKLTVHDTAVFSVAVPRKPGVSWELVEKSEAFIMIQLMIQQCVDDAVAEDRRTRP